MRTFDLDASVASQLAKLQEINDVESIEMLGRVFYEATPIKEQTNFEISYVELR